MERFTGVRRRISPRLHARSSAQRSQEPSAASSEQPASAAAPEVPAEAAFTCSICFDVPTAPVVTRCGHLYCWPCMHEWLGHKPTCPVCSSAVKSAELIPLYIGDQKEDPRNNIPPRPQAERVPPPPTGFPFADPFMGPIRQPHPIFQMHATLNGQGFGFGMRQESPSVWVVLAFLIFLFLLII